MTDKQKFIERIAKLVGLPENNIANLIDTMTEEEMAEVRFIDDEQEFLQAITSLMAKAQQDSSKPVEDSPAERVKEAPPKIIIPPSDTAIGLKLPESENSMFSMPSEDTENSEININPALAETSELKALHPSTDKPEEELAPALSIEPQVNLSEGDSGAVKLTISREEKEETTIDIKPTEPCEVNPNQPGAEGYGPGKGLKISVDSKEDPNKAASIEADSVVPEKSNISIPSHGEGSPAQEENRNSDPDSESLSISNDSTTLNKSFTEKTKEKKINKKPIIIYSSVAVVSLIVIGIIGFVLSPPDTPDFAPPKVPKHTGGPIEKEPVETYLHKWALHLKGKQKIQIPTPELLDSDKPFTLECWIYITNFKGVKQFYIKNSSDEEQFKLYINKTKSGKFYLNFRIPGAVISKSKKCKTKLPSDKGWIHIVAVYSPEKRKKFYLYINGKKVAEEKCIKTPACQSDKSP